MVKKAEARDIDGRFREIISDPLNLLIRRVPDAGFVEGNLVRLMNGHRVAVRGEFSYYQGFSSILTYNRGVHEPLEEFVFQEMLPRLPPMPVMIELGALWAHYSMWMLQARPQGRAFMIEADPVGLETGKRNFALNGYEGIFEQAMIGAGMLTVDDFVTRHGLDHIDVLHSDIQGFENDMLDGAAATLGAHKVDHVFISTHSQKGHWGIVQRMKEFGYRIDVNSPYATHTTSFDGFVLAVRPEIGLYVPQDLMGREAIAAASPVELANYILRIRNALVHLRGKAGLPMP